MHPLTLTAQYDIPVVIQASATFNVEVIHPCMKNVVKSSPIPNLTYIVGSPKLSQNFNSWSQTMGTCGSIIKYEPSLKLGGSAPAFLKVDSNLKTLDILTNDLTFYGTHELKLSAAPPVYYSSSSILDSFFLVNIQCVPKIIGRVQP